MGEHWAGDIHSVKSQETRWHTELIGPADRPGQLSKQQTIWIFLAENKTFIMDREKIIKKVNFKD